MPIGYSSPARNLFLLGSSGAQVVTNFFKQIDQASSGDFFHTPSEIRYTESDEKFILAGQADKTSPSSEKYGWIEKRQENGTQDWEVQVSSTTENNTTLRALELDGFNLVAVGKTGGVPWIAKYTDGGVITWQSTTNSGDVEYTGVAVDSNSNYYACGSTPVSGEAQAFVEKFDSSGNPGWGKSAFMVGRDVVLNKISANSRGEVVAVGYLEDDSYNKGYIVKIDTTTGDVMWDRTLELNIPAANIELTGVDVDNNDEIYVCGNIKYDVFGQTILPVDGFIAKYTAEGNLLWQSQSDYASGTSSAVYYEDITIDNTTKKPTTFGYVRYAVGDSGTLISRYDPDGSLSWRREIDEGNSFDPRHTSVDGDQSFIYLLFADTADSETYVYGKVSATGNGLGDFEYDDGTGAPLLQYITSSGPSGSDIGEKIGRLSDGSVRQDTSDLITYPFNANKLLFDSFEYSGSPAIRPADFQDLNLLGDVYSGSGNWLDQSGKGNDGVVNGATWNASGWWEFDGTPGLGAGDTINLGDTSTYNWIHDRSVSNWAIEGWFWNNIDEEYGALISNNSGTSTVGFYMGQRNDSQFECVINKGTVGTQACRVLSTNILDHNRWYHIVFVNENYTIKLYIDGVLQSNGGDQNSFATGSTADAQTDLRIGKLATSSAWNLNGRIGEIRIYKDRSLTPAQVFQNYNATKSKYINEAPETGPKIGPGIVYDSNLLLNYDFGNRATYDRVENLVAYSESVVDTWDGVFTTGLLDLIDSTGTDNTATTPVGTNNAGTLSVDSVGGRASVVLPSTIGETKNQQITYSAYLKAKDSTTCRIDLVNATNGSTDYGYRARATFDLAAGTVGSVTENSDNGNTDTPSGSTATIQNVGGGWYRCSVTFTSYNGSNALNATLGELRPNSGGSTGSVYAWGLQMERASLPGRYIRTSGTAITAPTTVKNLSSSSYTGTINGATFNPAGYFVFDGTDDYIDITSIAPLADTSAVTMEAWVNIDDIVNTYQVIGTWERTTNHWQFTYSGDTNYGLSLGVAGSSDSVGTANDLTSGMNSWQHVVATWNGGSLSTLSDWKIYVNGVSQTIQLTGATGTSGNDSYIGTRQGLAASNMLDGSMGEIRYYSRALTEIEVEQNFLATRGKYGV